MPARVLTDRQYLSLAEFRYQIRRFLRFSEQQSRAHGLRPQHYQLLIAIRGLPLDQAPTIGNLAERMQLEHHSLVELLDRASQQGLMVRKRDSRDRRRVGVFLTTKGERLAAELAIRHIAELQTAGRRLVTALRPLILHPTHSRVKA